MAQVRFRALQIAESLHAAASALVENSYSNPKTLLWILESSKAAIAAVSLADNELAGILEPSEALNTDLARPIPDEDAAMCGDEVVPCRPPLLENQAPSVAPEHNDAHMNEEEDILGDVATSRGPADAIGAVQNEMQEVNTSPCPGTNQCKGKKKQKAKKAKKTTKADAERSLHTGRPPSYDDLVAFAMLDKMIRCPELTLKQAAALANSKGEELSMHGSNGEPLVLLETTLRKRTEYLTKRPEVTKGNAWSDLKDDSVKEAVLEIIKEKFPNMYAIYNDGVEAETDTNAIIQDAADYPEDGSAENDNQHYGLRPQRQRRRRPRFTHHHRHRVSEEEEAEEEQEEQQQQQEETTMAHLATIKKEKPYPRSPREEEEASEEENNEWQGDGEEEEGEPILPVKSEPSQESDPHHSLFHNAGPDQGVDHEWLSQMMLNSSPLYSDEPGAGATSSPGYCRSNRFLTPPYPQLYLNESPQW
jgi:hypothetical protein